MSFRLTIPACNFTQVGTNGVSWSAFTWLSDYTLFMTRPRPGTALNTQTAPWTDAGGSQSGPARNMATIPPGAFDEYNKGVYPNDAAIAVVEEDSSSGNVNYTDGKSYHDALFGSYGSASWNGTFQGNPENTTINGNGNIKFTLLGQVARSDFYQLSPSSSSAPSKWLGYFELNTNGVMTYVAYPSTTPVITSVSRTNTTATLNFTTGLYGTYTLRGTNNLANAGSPASWPAITTLSSGDTAVHSYQDTDAGPVKFYSITAQ